MAPKEYRDKDVLEELYINQGLTQPEIADKYGVSNNTISRWIRKHDIEKPWKDRELFYEEYIQKDRSMREIAKDWNTTSCTLSRWKENHGIPDKESPNSKKDGLYKDREWLYRQREKKRSLNDIANECGISTSTLMYWFGKHDIDTWPDYQPSNVEPTIYLDNKGYVQIYGDSETSDVRLHRLVAVAEHGFDEVCGKVVHHKNGVRWDNRPENLELMTQSEHAKEHHKNGDFDANLIRLHGEGVNLPYRGRP